MQSSSDLYAEAERVAKETGGHYLDQSTNAERATDWRGNNNIADSIFLQMRDENHPTPDRIVVGAGTGGTSATIGRDRRYRRHATRLCVVTRKPAFIRPTPNLEQHPDFCVVADRGNWQATRRAVFCPR